MASGGREPVTFRSQSPTLSRYTTHVAHKSQSSICARYRYEKVHHKYSNTCCLGELSEIVIAKLIQTYKVDLCWISLCLVMHKHIISNLSFNTVVPII